MRADIMTQSPTTPGTGRTAAPHYDALTQFIHWVTVGAVAAAFIIGLVMEEMARGPAKTQLVNLHASLGVLVLVLTAVALSWRVVTAMPVPSGSPAMKLAAHAMHITLFALVLAIPLSGILMMAAKGRSFDVFGLFTVPPLMATDRALGETLEEAHEVLSYLLLGLVGLHAAAAIFHQMVLKDGTLSRMLPAAWTRKA